ncbi:MAG TPA: biotin-dependent carboxyltransferase family protein [Actinomycetota bacterium]|nr:biotin-dependent carboxyltransferase family protein [Actinomycetota bacterium]
MRIEDGGLLTTVQDLGRYGYQKVGVTPGGAMDGFSLRLANILVGNPEEAAALEITLRGPTVEFTSHALIALSGANLSPKISDLDIPLGRAVAVRRGSLLTFGRAVSGCRGYLAVAGGIDVPVVMGSRSTYLRAGIGGHEGRALRAGDELPIGAASQLATTTVQEALSVDDPLPFALSDRYVDRDDARLVRAGRAIRCVRGPHLDLMDDEDRQTLWASAFQVSTEADRMGYRLVGPSLSSARGRGLVSSAVTMGAIQIPPGGEPIVLMADRQTTGGYPVVGQVITADLPLVAQMKPGDELTLAQVDIAEAQEAMRETHRVLAEIKEEVDRRVSS